MKRRTFLKASIAAPFCGSLVKGNEICGSDVPKSESQTMTLYEGQFFYFRGIVFHSTFNKIIWGTIWDSYTAEVSLETHDYFKKWHTANGHLFWHGHHGTCYEIVVPWELKIPEPYELPLIKIQFVGVS